MAKNEKHVPLYWELVETVWDKISIYNGEKEFLKEFNKAPKEIGNLFATYWVVSEVLNGAIPQLFLNHTGVLVPEAISGFEAIGLPDAAKALVKATEIFGNSYPRSQSKRNEIIQESWIWGEEMDAKAERFLGDLLSITDMFYLAVGKKEEIYEEYANKYAKHYLDAKFKKT